MDSNQVPPYKSEDEDEDDAAAAGVGDEEEYDDQELIDEIEAERAAAAAAAPAVVTKRNWQVPPDFMKMNASEKLPLIRQLKRRDEMLLRQMDVKPKNRAELIARSGLSQKMLVKLGIDDKYPAHSLRNFREMTGKIGRRVFCGPGRQAGVHKNNVLDVVEIPLTPRLTNPMSLDELHDYLRIGRGKKDRGEPLVRVLPQFPAISFFTSSRRKCQLQQELLDDLKRILREKTAEIFQLERIHFATSNRFQQLHWGKQQGDAWRMQGTPPTKRWSTLKEDTVLAEKFSEEELTILKQQCEELRGRINELEEIIKEQNRNKDEPSCVINGGKTKSKKSNKSKKSKKSKRRN